MSIERMNTGTSNRSFFGFSDDDSFAADTSNDIAASRVGDAGLDPSSAASDDANAAEALRLARSGDPNERDEAMATANRIRDTDTRIRMQRLVGETLGSAYTPVLNKNKSGVGIDEPSKLFFMMVYYLKKYNPELIWSDILRQAEDSSGGASFQLLNPDIIRATASAQEAGARQDLNNATNAAKRDFGRAEATSKENLDEATQAARDGVVAAGGSVPAQSTSGGSGDGVDSIIVWPFQNLPEMSEYTKEVQWETVAQVSTMAEPVLSYNKGAGPIETSLTFTYAVGLGGLDDSYDDRGVDAKWWTVEEVMAMAYLAMSTVFPFLSPPIFSVNNKDADVAQRQSENAAAQFPIVFMRHWQYFPFLTPFVVKSVTVAADDDQPLLISEPENLGSTDSHLSIPAVRQILKITLNLTSAHYYLSVLKSEDTNNAEQIRIQTSGQTYLNLAKALLPRRV